MTIDGREVERLAFDLTEQTMAATKRASVPVDVRFGSIGPGSWLFGKSPR